MYEDEMLPPIEYTEESEAERKARESANAAEGEKIPPIRAESGEDEGQRAQRAEERATMGPTKWTGEQGPQREADRMAAESRSREILAREEGIKKKASSGSSSFGGSGLSSSSTGTG